MEEQAQDVEANGMLLEARPFIRADEEGALDLRVAQYHDLKYRRGSERTRWRSCHNTPNYSADLLLVGGADVEVAQKGPAHFVSQFGVGAAVVAGSERDRCGAGERKKKQEAEREKNQLKRYLGKI